MINSLVKTVLGELLLLLVCLLGDHLLTHPVANQHIIIRALTDSLTHGFVGGISWAVVTGVHLDRQHLTECILCMCVAMSVDLDHFAAAKSFQLKDALSLQKRPFMHATTVVIVIDGILFSLSLILRTRLLQLFSLIFTVAILSHHVRDSVRRGLWFPPFGETLPLSRLLYLTMILFIPLATKFVYDQWRTYPSHRTLFHYFAENV